MFGAALRSQRGLPGEALIRALLYTLTAPSPEEEIEKILSEGPPPDPPPPVSPAQFYETFNADVRVKIQNAPVVSRGLR